MFFVSWLEDGRTYECCCNNSQTAWLIYWAMKKRLEPTNPTEDCLMWITSCYGCHHDPTQGGSLPLKNDTEGTLLKARVEV